MKPVLTFLLLLCFASAKAQTKNFIDQPFIEVNGIADTFLIPNEIFIRILISEKDSRDRVSVEEQEVRMVNALKAIGINPEVDLVINDLGSNYKFYLLKSKDIIKSKLYILKVTDAVTASKVFMKLEDLDISNTSIDRVDHTAKENIANLLRVKAVENARQRAGSLTRPLNQAVGQAIHITDGDVQNNTRLQYGKVSGIIIRGTNSIGAFDQKFDTPKIEFEKIHLVSNVQVKFMLR
jgi:hypothetical protein